MAKKTSDREYKVDMLAILMEVGASGISIEESVTEMAESGLVISKRKAAEILDSFVLENLAIKKNHVYYFSGEAFARKAKG